MITIGIDPHSRTHVAAALDDHGRVLAELAVGSNPRELDRLARWIAGIGTHRIVAIEGARGFGLALCRRLQGAGETIIDVAPALTVAERRSAGVPARMIEATPLRWRESRCASRPSRGSPSNRAAPT